MKTHLAKILGDHPYTYEQYATFLAEISACLNSRPIGPESPDPNDLNPLTPGHFLVGGSLTAMPNRYLIDIPENRLNHWERIKKLTQIFKYAPATTKVAQLYKSA